MWGWLRGQCGVTRHHISFPGALVRHPELISGYLTEPVALHTHTHTPRKDGWRVGRRLSRQAHVWGRQMSFLVYLSICLESSGCHWQWTCWVSWVTPVQMVNGEMVPLLIAAGGGGKAYLEDPESSLDQNHLEQYENDTAAPSHNGRTGAAGQLAQRTCIPKHKTPQIHKYINMFADI